MKKTSEQARVENAAVCTSDRKKETSEREKTRDTLVSKIIKGKLTASCTQL